jgi:hypothetical protein
MAGNFFGVKYTSVFFSDNRMGRIIVILQSLVSWKVSFALWTEMPRVLNQVNVKGVDMSQEASRCT